MPLTPYQRTLLRDIRDGHLTIWRSGTEDLPDREMRGGLRAWVPLAEDGYIEIKLNARFWTLTDKGWGELGEQE